MAGELLIFDAAASNVDGTDPGSALNIGPGTSYGIREFSAPAPPQTVQYAGSVDTEGSLPSSRKHENRVITVKILCSTAAALRTLQGKVGKVAREGGTLKWVLPNAETVIFDLLTADTFEPVIDKLLYVRAGAFCEITVTLLAKPYGRGAEVDLGDNVETTLPLLVFTDSVARGDWSGLGRLVIDNDDASNTQRRLLWGIQSRYYSSASTAALFYEAESCSLGSAVVATGPAGASGGASNNTAANTTLSSSGYLQMIVIGASATAQTHVGTFRVFTRAQAPNTNGGIVSLQAQWKASLSGPTISNDPVALVDSAGAAIEAAWLLVDLGLVSIPQVRLGSQGWLGSIYATSTTTNDDIYLDWVMLVPVDEGNGDFYSDQTTLLTKVETSGSAQVRYDGAFASVTGGYYTPLNPYEGDYLFLPPAGAEARTLRTLVKLSRGNPLADAGDGVCYDSGTDDISARLFYTPRYLVVPEP